jgi:hypothetical protein
MRTLLVVATTSRDVVNMFAQASLTEARNLKDFLKLTGEYTNVGVYELEKSVGPLRQWTELHESV